jgi:hypothetical protein
MRRLETSLPESLARNRETGASGLARLRTSRLVSVPGEGV